MQSALTHIAKTPLCSWRSLCVCYLPSQVRYQINPPGSRSTDDLYENFCNPVNLQGRCIRTLLVGMLMICEKSDAENLQHLIFIYYLAQTGQFFAPMENMKRKYEAESWRWCRCRWFNAPTYNDWWFRWLGGHVVRGRPLLCGWI